jgi:glycosyltransferase involved in cell wall biosynthesis
MKIAVITCYRDPDYIRARALRASLALIEGVEVIIIKNSHLGVLRYPEIMWKILKTRVTRRPNVYLLTFRGDEMLPIIRLLTIGKPLIFDELVNAVAWVIYEHKKLRGLPAKIVSWGYGLWTRSCRVILSDTDSHADASSAISKIDRHKYAVIPVGTDETAFRYRQPVQLSPGVKFRVFFYGAMLPLHGPQYVIEAAELLKDNSNITFLIAGKIGKYEQAIIDAQGRGARIEYRQWIPFDELPQLVAESAINIAGPFGNTYQAQHVINGKTYQFLASGSVALIGRNKNTKPFINHVNCLMVPQADAQAITTEIDWAYHHQDQLPAIAVAGRALYDERYSNKVIAEELRQILRGL